mmetsp:Transcript_30125/g.69526  ORF Transcript_30125/g.69526 Transcript_30125/m.69526 type:complete len:166 (+) Transcript_30125:317-814(+)
MPGPIEFQLFRSLSEPASYAIRISCLGSATMYPSVFLHSRYHQICFPSHCVYSCLTYSNFYLRPSSMLWFTLSQTKARYTVTTRGATSKVTINFRWTRHIGGTTINVQHSETFCFCTQSANFDWHGSRQVVALHTQVGKFCQDPKLGRDLATQLIVFKRQFFQIG